MKTALALGGGGAKGAYEVGVYKALLAMNIKIDIVTGTSIGSLNGALIVQDEFDVLQSVWDNVTKDYIIKRFNTRFQKFDNPSLDVSDIKKIALNFNYDDKSNKNDIPLKILIRTILNEQKLRESNIEFGIVCVSFPSMKPLELTLDDIPKGKVSEYLLASSSIFPALPLCKIDEKYHIDGGYYDNVPIDFAINMGADYVIAVDLYVRPNHPHYQNSPIVKYIKPSKSLGHILEFDRKTIENNIALGYNDTLKAFDKAQGFDYTFRQNFSNKSAMLADGFVKNIYSFESLIHRKSIRHTKRINLPKIIYAPLTNVLKTNIDRKFSSKDFFIQGAEICMDILKIPTYKIYDLDNVNEVLIKNFSNRDEFCSVLSFRAMAKDAFKEFMEDRLDLDLKYLVGSILYNMIENKFLSDEIFTVARLFPRETIAAFYLYALMSDGKTLKDKRDF